MASNERSYTHRSLLDKLGVKPEHRIALRNVKDNDFIRQLFERLEHQPSRTLQPSLDIIFLQVNVPADLDAIASVKPCLAPAGALWIFHPKGKGVAVTDGEVRSAAVSSGLVDNKICSYNTTHTATRYVIPVKDRR